MSVAITNSRSSGLRSIVFNFDRHDMGVRLFPERACYFQCVDATPFPPGDFISHLMKLPVMATAEWYRKLIADLEADSARLREPQVVRIARLTAADDTRLRRDKPQVCLIAKTLGLADCQNAFVDRLGRQIRRFFGQRKALARVVDALAIQCVRSASRKLRMTAAIVF